MEIDVVAESIDKKFLLVGECKWSKIDNTDKLLEELTRKAGLLPFAQNKKIIAVVFVRESGGKQNKDSVILPSNIMERLKH
jgi:hypothetical protein